MAKREFNDEQFAILLDVVKRNRRRFKNQTEMALALGITQPSLSALLKGKWMPSEKNARHIASLDQVTLEKLLPNWDPELADSAANAGRRMAKKGETSIARNAALPNLETCVSFYSTTKQWSPWTIAAARAGFFGPRDYAPPDWADKLDKLEAHMSKAKKA